MSILMIGTQRSGSNLLRLMLDQIPTIFAPHPPHILQRMMPLLPSYGDLNQKREFALLVDDVCRLVEMNPVEWDGVYLSRKEVISRCQENSLIAVFAAIYDIATETWGKQTWCCKSLANVHYLWEINEYIRDAKYLYLYRDGRDVAVSFKKAVVGEKHFYHIAKQWRSAQLAAIRMRELLPEDKFFSISYEALTSNTEASLKQICHFLAVEYTPEMLNFHQSKEALKTSSSSSLWQNVTKPLMTQNTQKFLTEASEEEVHIFECIAGDALEALGYDLVTSPFNKESIARFDQENQRLKAEVRKNMDSEDLKRRERQGRILQEINNRNLAIA